MGQRENVMEICAWQQFRLSVIEPFFFYKSLAFWAVPVPAGVIRILFKTTLVTYFGVSAERCCTAYFDMAHGVMLLRM
jgi:hypothetical protein